MIDGDKFLATGMKVEKKDEVLERGKRIAEELGLTTATFEASGYIKFYPHDTIHRLLGEGVDVWAHFETDKPKYWGPHENNNFNDTHTGIVIGIRQIVQESEERRLLRELTLKCERQKVEPHSFTRLDLSDIYERAKKLLEE